MLMEKKSYENIPGTTFSTQNGHLLTSSGVQSLDSLLGKTGLIAFFVHF